MKKIMLLFMMMTLTLGIAACGLFDNGDDNGNGNGNGDPTPIEAELVADAFIANWSGDLTFLSAFMQDMNANNQYEVVTTLYMEGSHYDYWTEETYSYYNEVTMVDKFVRLTDSTLLQREMTIENDEMVVTFNMIIVTLDDGVILYLDFANILDQLPPDILTEVIDMFAIHNDWIKMQFDDSLANLVEIELIKEFLKQRLMEEYDVLKDLDAIEDMFLDMIGADKLTANIQLQVLFDTLFTFSPNAIVLHLFGIDYGHLVDSAIVSQLVSVLINDFEMNESILRAAGFDYDTYYPLLMNEGFFAFVDAMTNEQALILDDVFMMPASSIIEALQSEDPVHASVMLFLDLLEEGMTPVEEGIAPEHGLDFELIRDTFETLDLEALYIQAQLFNYDGLLEALVTGRYTSYLNALPENEMKELIQLFSTLLINNLGEAAIVFEYFTLIEDLSRFDKYLDLNFFGSHEHANISLNKTPEFHIETEMIMGPEMMEAFILEFFNDVWLWIDQLETVDLPLVDPLNCTGLECDVWHELIDVIAYLETMDPLSMTMLFDPVDPDMLWLELDLTDFMNFLSDYEEYDVFRLNITVKDTTSVTVPTDVFSVNEMMDEVGMFMMMMLFGEMMHEWMYQDLLSDVYALRDLTNTEIFKGVLDLDLSYIEVFGDDIDAVFYYIDGSPVFTKPLNFLDIEALSEQDLSRAFLLDLIDYFDQTNFRLTRMIGLLFNEAVNQNPWADDPYYEENFWYSVYPPHVWYWDDLTSYESHQHWFVYVYSQYDYDSQNLRWTLLDFYFDVGYPIIFIDIDDIWGEAYFDWIPIPALFIMNFDQVLETYTGQYMIDNFVYDYLHGYYQFPE